MKSRIVKRIALSLVLIVVSAAMTVGVLWLLPQIMVQQAEFNQEVRLQLNQTAIFVNGNETIKLKLVELEQPTQTDSEIYNCELCAIDTGLSAAGLPSLKINLSYADKTWVGGTRSQVARELDMSYYESESDAYALIPYTIKLIETDMRSYASFKVSKKEFIQVSLGQEFRLGDGGIALLKPGETGVMVGFSRCTSIPTCMDDIRLSVNGKYVSTGELTNNWQDEGEQGAAKLGATVELDGIRLRLIDSDNATYSTFVFEAL